MAKETVKQNTETYADTAKRIINKAFQSWCDGNTGSVLRNAIANDIQLASRTLDVDSKRELFEIIRERAEQLKRFTELVNSEVQTHTGNVGSV